MYDHMETPVMDVPHASHEGLTLPQHEANSAHRAAQIEHSIEKLKEETMSISERGQDVNIFQRDGLGAMGGFGGGHAGMGAGVGGFAGAALGSLLLGRRGGLFGGDGDGNGGAETRIESDIFNTAVLAKLGNIEAAIPLQSAQMTNVVLAQTNEIQNLASQAQLANQAGFASVKDAVINTGIVNLTATNNQGDRIVALINANELANLNRQLTVADLDRRDERSFGRSREVEVNVSQVVNQAQAQAQLQAQQQQQTNLLTQLAFGFNTLQNAVATNSNLIIGNTGATTTGAQTANPVNVRA